MTDLIDIYALLPKNVSFLECFLRSHIYFIRYCNNPMKIRFCGVFLKNHKYLREMFLRRLRKVTNKTSFLRYARDVLKTSHKIHVFLRCFWGVLQTSQKRHLLWDVFETSQKGHKEVISFKMFLRGLWDISFNGDLRGLWDISFNGDLIQISQRHLTPPGLAKICKIVILQQSIWKVFEH